MMKNILSILVLLPMFVFGNAKTNNHLKKSRLYSVATSQQYPDYYQAIPRENLISDSSVWGDDYGRVEMQNNILWIDFNITWQYNVYYNTGIIANLNIYPALPNMELGEIYSDGYETGYFIKIEDNNIVVYNPSNNPYDYFGQYFMSIQIDMNCVSYWYEDRDNDGYGNPNVIPIPDCYEPTYNYPIKYVKNNLDCDDTNLAIGYQRWYLDNDNDGYGSTTFVESCTDPTYNEHYALNNTDCDDSDSSVHRTSNWALDINGDGIISDLDGSTYVSSCSKPNGNYLSVLDDKNHWIQNASYDIKGNPTGSSRTYFDDLGKANVSLSKDYVQNKIWGTEITYDDFGRPNKSSFTTPSPLSGFEKVGFLSSSTNYSSANANLINYYSDNNTDEPFQATATQPYSETNYDSLNPGNVINVVGGNKTNNEWKTGYSYTVPAAQEMYYVYGSDYYAGNVVAGKEEVITKFYKSVSVDANGVENVVFSDGEGKVLASARSGGTASYLVVSLIGTQGFVDVHIPAGITTGQINLIGGASLYKVYDLKTGLIVTSSLTGGYAYRIEALTPPATDPKAYIYGNVPTYDTGALGIEYRVNYYDYSVNVYNKTGQLIKSIQPKGYATNPAITILSTPTYLNSGNFTSTFLYNSLGQLIETTSPDEGTSRFAYRKDGQIRYSQNANQRDSKVSYTDYDTYARPIESGVIKMTTGIWGLATANPDAALIGTVAQRSEQTFTVYDDASNNSLLSVVIPTNLTLSGVLATAGISATNYVQNNLSGNVAITYTKVGPDIIAITWYSYDIYGRSQWVVQYNKGIGAKTIDYEYDYKGNVGKVVFQKYKAAELFAHRYTYNANDVLQKVETSTNNSTFITHTDYSYYLTGELKRVNIAQGTQGLDYVYTLGGQLKSINHPSLEAAKDPGGDTNDVFGITLDYYSGDYLRTGRNITSSPTAGADYNGNIKASRWANKGVAGDYNGSTANQKAYLYDYDRNNFLTTATFGTTDTNTAAISPTNNYKEGNLTYDSNGNIQTLQRTNDGGTTMDNLAYNYSGKNQLTSVNDTEVTADLNDIENQAAGNYVYNKMGQLIQNVLENLSYIYNAQGLVSEVGRLSTGNTLVKFFYNERGQRIKKESYESSGSGVLQNTTFYILDISGNTMAVYSKTEPSTSIIQTDLPLYGLSRLGVYNRASATSNYEITDHLGNVRAVIQKVSGNPVIQSFADYYPFGELLPTRNSLNYRYAFQGQELDKETSMEAFQLRLWDGRIGRWLSPDPMAQYASPYLGMGNNPIGMIDPDGGFSWAGASWRWAVGGFQGTITDRSSTGQYGIDSGQTSFDPGDGSVGIKNNIKWHDATSDFYNRIEFTTDIQGKFTLGFQAGARLGLGKLEAGVMTSQIGGFNLGTSGNYTFGKDEEELMHNFIGGEIGGVKLGGLDIGIGGKYDYTFSNKSYGGGIRPVAGSGKHNWEYNILLAKSTKGFDVIPGRIRLSPSLKYKEIHKDKTFHGLDLGASAKLILGVDINGRIGVSY